MKIRISKGMAENVGMKDVQKMFNLGDWTFKHENTIRVDIANYTVEEVEEIQKLFLPHKHVRGVGMLLSDVDMWTEAIKNPTKQKLRNTQQFSVLLKSLLGDTERKHIYNHDKGAWYAYYVSDIAFHEERESRDGVTPAYTEVNLLWEEFGGRKRWKVCFGDDEVRSMSVKEALAKQELYFETDQRRLEYLNFKDVYLKTVEKIGTQFWARGVASDKMDGNKKGNDSWHWREEKIIEMEKDGQPSQVVIDVFYEDNKEREDEHSTHNSFWPKQKVKLTDEDKKEGLKIKDLQDMVETDFIPEVPLHPMAAVFDLKKHLRLKTHVSNLEEYIYDKDMAEKLVLQREVKDLVHVLLEHRASSFSDVVRGKAGGVVVLLTGAPGTGKTLTAEIYAESEGRPLYSVQASQLGTNEEMLEDYLMKTLLRAKRWNAVMLLDEADVYIRHRGSDLQQNSIVGVFLRVLEYHSSVLFMTTNKGDEIDDAIASRCIARIEYTNPGVVDQAKIWRILADVSKIKLSTDEIEKIVSANVDISGRDVKNLLKLANMVSKAKGKEVTAETVEFVKRFKPTRK